MQHFQYMGPAHETSQWHKGGDRLWLHRLCGLTCGNDGDDFKLLESRFDAETARIVWSVDDTLRLESTWSFCGKTGVVSRRAKSGEPSAAAI